MRASVVKNSGSGGAWLATAELSAVRQQAEWGKLKNRIVTPERRIRYQEEHREIVQALRERDAESARAAIVAHLQHARRNLFGY